MCCNVCSKVFQCLDWKSLLKSHGIQCGICFTVLWQLMIFIWACMHFTFSLGKPDLMFDLRGLQESLQDQTRLSHLIWGNSIFVKSFVDIVLHRYWWIGSVDSETALKTSYNHRCRQQYNPRQLFYIIGFTTHSLSPL